VRVILRCLPYSLIRMRIARIVFGVYLLLIPIYMAFVPVIGVAMAACLVLIVGFQVFESWRTYRSHEQRADRWLWWQPAVGDDPLIVALAMRRDGCWYLHGLNAYPRGNGGVAFDFVVEHAQHLDGPITLNAANLKLAGIYQTYGFHIDRTRPYGRPRTNLAGTIPMTKPASEAIAVAGLPVGAFR
jgi:hypothetical protein